MVKKIMFDGINVAGCEFAVKPKNDNRIKCHCAKGLLQIAKMQEQPESIKSGLCENNTNCYYKQLQCLKQENERLKTCLEIQRTDETKQYIEKVNFERENYKLKAENERLKEEMKVLQYNIAEYSNNNIDTAVTLFAKDKAKLEEENALLKAYKNKYYQQTLDDEIKLNELYQVLQEIKGIATALYMNEWLQQNETAKQSIQLLQKLLDKAEVE